jgi:taurine--2-oxoglutarate transaminase
MAGKKIDWEEVKVWDEKYYLHIARAKKEYIYLPIASTEGSYIITPEGKKLLDFSSQYVCVNIGQRYPRIQAAIREAADRFGFVGELHCTDYRAEAAKLIIEDLLGPDGWAGKIRFLNSGSEAVELALIIAKLYTNRPNIITREHSYHGWTMGAAGCTRLRPMRNALGAVDSRELREVPGFSSGGYYGAPAPFCFRCSFGLEYPACKMGNGKLPCVQATENLIKGIGPETVAAFITEVVHSAAAIFPPPEYIPQIRRMTKELGILWIDDEVICGFGRLGKWFGYQWYEGVQPDIMTLAKGIVSSALPASGVVVSKEIGGFFEQYRWWSINTFAAHPLSMAAVAANLEAMIEMNLPNYVCEAGQYLEKQLSNLQDRHRSIGLIQGQGLLWGIELVKDRDRREPFVKIDRYDTFSGEIKKYPSNIIRQKCAEKGVLIGGYFPNTPRLAPPLTVSYEEIDRAIEALDHALVEVDKMCD